MKNFHSTHIRGFFGRIRTILSYVPVLWYDHDWDQYYFFVLMRHKLRRMDKKIAAGPLLYRQEISYKIKICHLLLDRLIENDYASVLSKEHDEKWGF